MKRAAAALTLVAFSFTACDNAPKQCSSVKSTSNRVSCKVNYATLQTDKLSGIQITDNSIPASEKIRHLNEINSWPTPMLDIFRADIPIKLTHGGITNLPEYASLKGQTPRGWPAGSTWDSVPGTGTEAGLILGDSSLGNNAWSLATHEGTHSIDRKLGLSAKNSDIINAYNSEKDSPNPNDTNGAYRMQNIEEWLAIAVDEYYCNDETKANLKSWYPKSYAFVENKWLNTLTASGVGIAAQTTTASSSNTNTANRDPNNGTAQIANNSSTTQTSDSTTIKGTGTVATNASDGQEAQSSTSATRNSADSTASKLPDITDPGPKKTTSSVGVAGCE